ncbi:glutathione S-transferase family protein [Pseudoxanthomonas winnipegensis]|uniref:Glutathione S-transferase family protein n=1 Tax=Pseudoxanthomonas winnipegensis TaxID=2480810 RepID=A0A4Q8M4S8_9GAMM|nr:glutathione S-transferase family protein [Pseudoxanthomonas winnipegensis]TAA40864.1 glutathione S-transferase family protein [Pseudoxanthomonas winnipegensis]WJI16027.1 glutathione S-transferase family protein [Pseudoxanthomonas winnipegensis]
MILIGMFDSPFVRRVAVSMDVLGMPFEHRDWSTGRDADRIRAYNPLGRVPTLVLDDEAVLFESSAVLDHLDQTVGAERALLPAAGAERRQALQLIALATGVADKAVTMVYERVFRPEDKRHGPWLARCQTQVEHALAALETHCTARAGHDWLIGERMTQADITLACCCSFAAEAVPFDLSPYPAVQARVARYEALPVLKKFHVAFDAPT